MSSDEGTDHHLQSTAEMAAHYGGPVVAADRWFKAVFDDADWETAWSLMTHEFQTALAQDWVWANREHRDFMGHDRDEDVAQLVAGSHRLWQAFARIKLLNLRDTFPDCSSHTWGIGSRPRLIDPTRELVLWVDTGGESLLAMEPMRLPGFTVLMEHADELWLVANIEHEAPPQTGWPPVLQP